MNDPLTPGLPSEIVAMLRVATSAPNPHVVQFYDAEDYLCDTVAAYCLDGLRNGERVVVVATRAHRGGIAARLTGAGVDLDTAIRADSLILVDAWDTLSSFLVGALPDETLFARAIGDRVRRLASDGRRIRAYGEMVDLLWRDGKPEGAIALERIWNTIAARDPMTVLCSYAMGAFHGHAHDAELADICREHSFVIPAERFRPAAAAADREALIQQIHELSRALDSERAYRAQLEAALCKLLAEKP